MKRIGIVITDGVGYRNFIMSNFLQESSLKFDEVIIYSGLPKNTYDSDNHWQGFKNIKIIELAVFIEPKKTWFFRKLKEVAHMILHKKYYGINDNLQKGYPVNFTKRSVLIKIIYAIAQFFHSEKSISKFEKLQFNSFKNHSVTKDCIKLLEKNIPDILFFTHQRPPYLAPLLFAAKSMQIKTSAFIFSWDNLASKGRMLGNFDFYLVWSDLMKKELLYFYPHSNNENVKVVGTPQFEPYVMDKYQVDKDSFYQKFNLDVNKKIICYSCADADIGRNDEIHIRAILSFIKKSSEELQLLVRTSPAEDGKRFESLRNEFPQICWNFPKWVLTRVNHVESWSQRVPNYEDVLDLKSILKFADVNVNMCSTMSLDYMLFDKPVINTVFGNDTNGLYNDQRFLNYGHYKYVIDSKAVTIAKNEEELHQQLNEALSKPELRAVYRKELIQFEISKPLEGTSKRIVEA
ncbi:MAG: hypothetical protein PSN34_10570, partial [Urechidicola sp.]|nr:hypothetical protein [Urechidicola sp.]